MGNSHGLTLPGSFHGALKYHRRINIRSLRESFLLTQGFQELLAGVTDSIAAPSVARGSVAGEPAGAGPPQMPPPGWTSAAPSGTPPCGHPAAAPLSARPATRAEQT